MTLAVISANLPAMTGEALSAVRELERQLLACEQVPIRTHHQIHGGIYTRTICIPAGVAMTGALLKVPTTLVISGDLTVYTGHDEMRVTGYAVIPGSAGRKQAVYAHADTWVSMSFPTQAMSVEEAENEFTDETDLLFSRNEGALNSVTITGD
jgi:hypothetical protein